MEMAGGLAVVMGGECLCPRVKGDRRKKGSGSLKNKGKRERRH